MPTASPYAALVERIVRLYELDGVFGLVALAQRTGGDVVQLAEAYTRLGDTLGLDWAQSASARFTPADGWERLLTAGLARDFETLRLEFLERVGPASPAAALSSWEGVKGARVGEFRRLVDRARTTSVTGSDWQASRMPSARSSSSRTSLLSIFTSPSSSRTAHAEHSPSRQEYGALTPFDSRCSSSLVVGVQSS